MLAAISHHKPSIVLSHGLCRLASHKDCDQMSETKLRLWGVCQCYEVSVIDHSLCACRSQVTEIESKLSAFTEKFLRQATWREVSVWKQLVYTTHSTRHIAPKVQWSLILRVFSIVWCCCLSCHCLKCSWCIAVTCCIDVMFCHITMSLVSC